MIPRFLGRPVPTAQPVEKLNPLLTLMRAAITRVAPLYFYFLRLKFNLW
jgi:hypothetical protein